jgi:hypothetical protein
MTIMAISDAQKSEVHEATADASSRPTNVEDSETTRKVSHATAPWDGNKLDPDPPVDTRIVRDDTDAGGPLVVESSDPDLNPPKAPIDPFPTERTPEIDPPVKPR